MKIARIPLGLIAHRKTRLVGVAVLVIACVIMGRSSPSGANQAGGAIPVVGFVEHSEFTSGNTLRVRGIAINPTFPENVPAILQFCSAHLHDGSVCTELQRADVNHPNVVTDFPGYGDAHGFDVTVNAVRGDTIRVYMATLDAEGLAKWVQIGEFYAFNFDARIELKPVQLLT